MTFTPQLRAEEQPVESPDVAGTEICLVRRSVAGDLAAFEEIVRLHSSRVFNYVRQMTRHHQDAEDIAQQTFIKAFTHIARFDPDHSFIAWLLTIARRTALNHFRAAKQWEPMAEAIASADPTPASQAEKNDLTSSIWTEARQLLSPREFEVLWLRYAEDRSIAETAQITGLTQTHIKVLVFRARQRLMKLQSRS